MSRKSLTVLLCGLCMTLMLVVYLFVQGSPTSPSSTQTSTQISLSTDNQHIILEAINELHKKIDNLSRNISQSHSQNPIPATSVTTKSELTWDDCSLRLDSIRRGFQTAWICRNAFDKKPFNCFMKCPKGRWVNNGWLDVEDMFPLMKPTLQLAGSSSNAPPLVYMDVGCKHGEETTAVLKEFPDAKVVALEMRPDKAKVCKEKSQELANDPSQVVVLNKAAAAAPGAGNFLIKGDSSSITLASGDGHLAPPGGPKSEPIEFVKLDDVWREHIAPHKVQLLKTDAEGWDGLILRDGATRLMRENILESFIFEYHGKSSGVYYHGSLKEFVFGFWEMGYMCFHITCPFLFPITPPELWLPEYEYYAQGNVFCALKDSALLADTYDNFFGDPGFKGTFEARKTEPMFKAASEPPLHIATNYTGFVAEFGDLLRHNQECFRRN